MTKNNTKIKSKILAGTVAVLMGTSLGVIGTSKIAKPTSNVYAYQNTISVSNGNFSSTSSGSPAIPTSWTGIEKYSNTTSGIVNLATTNQDTISNDYNLESLPSPKDPTESTKNVLMINANNGAYYAGYQTSSSTTFESQSYYRITVETFTFSGTQTIGSFSLSGEDKIEKLDNSVVKINGTDSSWTTYTIYLATSQFDSLSLKTNLMLGYKQQASDGAIFFDNLSITKFDKETFDEHITLNTTNSIFIDLRDEGNVSNFLTNADFENGLNGWTKCEDVSVGKNIYSNVEAIGAGFDLLNVENPNSSLSPTSYALLLNNIESAHQGYASSDITINQYGIYKLSVWAKASADAKATIKLVEHSPYSSEISYTPQTFTISNVAQYQNDYTNGWKEYSFYIKGNPHFDEVVNLELWLGTTDTDSNGYVWFDNITLTKITSAQFDANSSNGTEANLYKSTSSLDITNANFDLYTVDSLTQEYPYGVADWTASNTSNGTRVGILNTNKATENKIILGSDLPILANTTKNNVLMILNNNYQSQTVKSNSLTFSSVSYYKIDVYALANTNGQANISVLCDDVVLAEQSEITASNWTLYSFYIKTGFEEKTVNIELGLGKNVACTGYACFDRVFLTKYENEEIFNDAVANKTAYSKVSDLTKIDFSNIGTQIEDNFYYSNDFTGELKDGTSATIIAGVDKTNNKLVISSLNDEIYYTFTSKSKYSLEKGGYYKFEFTIKTYGIIQDEQNTKGAKIYIDGIGASFKQIDTNNEQKTYSIYVKCTEEQKVSLVISLGDSDALTQGSLEVSNINIQKIDADVYQNDIKVLEKSNAPDNILAIGNTDSATDEEENNSNSSSGIEFNFLYASTIITGLAIIIAVVGAVLRQYRKKHKRKVNVKKQKTKSSEKTVKDVHKDNIRTLNAQITKLNDKQTQLAEEINSLNAENAEENKEKVDELVAEYNENKLKIEKLNEQKKESNKKYHKKVSQMKQDKKAENSLSKKR